MFLFAHFFCCKLIFKREEIELKRVFEKEEKNNNDVFYRFINAKMPELFEVAIDFDPGYLWPD